MFIREISVSTEQPSLVNLTDIPELTEDECLQVSNLLMVEFQTPNPVLPSPGQLYLLMEDNLVLAVGMLSQAITQLPSNYQGKIITNVVTHPMYRRHGLARYLLVNMLFQVSEPVYLMVKLDNVKAINLYHKLKFGFKHLMFHDTPSGPESLWLMVRSSS